MRRQLLGLGLVFAAVFAVMYALTSSVSPPPNGQSMPIEVSVLLATCVTLLVSMFWTIWRAVRDGPWKPRTRAHEAHAAIVSTPWWHPGPVDCAGGSTDAGGCGDFGG